MMDNNHLLEILYGVFAKDTNSFLNFVLIEKDIAISCENSEKDYHFAEISTQLDFIYKKIEEDARRASSQKVELLKITNIIYDD